MDSLTTIVAPIRESDIPAIDAAIAQLGNPCTDAIRAKLEPVDASGNGVHFMSLHAIPSGDGETGHIVFEFTADGAQNAAIKKIANAIGAELASVFAFARDYNPNTNFAGYLQSRVIGVGTGIFANPGLCFAGTPGMSVGRIRKERELAAYVADIVDSGVTDVRPIDRLAAVRRTVEADGRFGWALEPPPPPLRDAAKGGIGSLIGKLAVPLLLNFFWPAVVIVGIVFLVTLYLTMPVHDALILLAWTAGVLLLASLLSKLWPLGLALLAVALGVFAYTRPWPYAFYIAGWTAVALFVLILIAVGALYIGLRRQEATDWQDPRSIDAEVLASIREHENHGAQNHMVSITRRKPGVVRWYTIRFAFWLIGALATNLYKPGYLGGISTIHAARWITVPGTRNLVFFSNFGGSWESYLEDFITRAHDGLTAVWSNSIGFPRANNLFQDGATDGERFKRYARASMKPTLFWYTAYPDLTTDHVRNNALMRRGLAAALTNDEAADWLSLFGSARRPAEKLESNEIQSLVFGGLGFMPHGTCLLYRLPDDRQKARAFLAAIAGDIGYGDGRRLQSDAVLTLALGASALPKLGLPEACVKGFPAAFLEGMCYPPRARILGDIGKDAPENWQWGDCDYDLALLAYGVSDRAVTRLEKKVAAAATAQGMVAARVIPMQKVVKPVHEAFGFLDGVSQPVIRGTYQAYRNPDPIHLVEPGEFIIGYPDGRGNFPPEPTLSALLDPENRLPVNDSSYEFGNSIVDSPRSIGRNGTFLVIRQLEQDVKAFDAYCAEEAERIKDRMPTPYEVTPEFIGAKLIGRWKDGSSLIRNPYYALSDRRKNRAAYLATQPKDAEATGMRPESNPERGTSIAATPSRNPRADNEFLYGVEDPQGLRCPYGAHARRANPRDSLVPGSSEQVDISNRHRIYRVGRQYQHEKGRDPGLFFMCLNGDIERQFEFLQQTWMANPSFHGLSCEQDPLNSRDPALCKGFLVPSLDGPVRLKSIPQFVSTLGGGYFFMPGRSAIRYLSGT